LKSRGVNLLYSFLITFKTTLMDEVIFTEKKCVVLISKLYRTATVVEYDSKLYHELMKTNRFDEGLKASEVDCNMEANFIMDKLAKEHGLDN
jgi:hypothetical protein